MIVLHAAQTELRFLLWGGSSLAFSMYSTFSSASSAYSAPSVAAEKEDTAPSTLPEARSGKETRKLLHFSA